MRAESQATRARPSDAVVPLERAHDLPAPCLGHFDQDDAGAEGLVVGGHHGDASRAEPALEGLRQLVHPRFDARLAKVAMEVDRVRDRREPGIVALSQRLELARSGRDRVDAGPPAETDGVRPHMLDVLAAHVQNSRFLRSAEPLVAARGERVAPEIPEIDAQRTPGLGAIDVDEDVASAGHFADCLDRQQNAGCVGHLCDGEDPGPRAEGVREEVHQPFLAQGCRRRTDARHAQIGSRRLDVPGDVVRRMVFIPEDDLVTGAQGQAANDSGVSFRGVAYQRDFFRIHAEMDGHSRT